MNPYAKIYEARMRLRRLTIDAVDAISKSALLIAADPNSPLHLNSSAILLWSMANVESSFMHGFRPSQRPEETP